jgi:hypothetical protein
VERTQLTQGLHNHRVLILDCSTFDVQPADLGASESPSPDAAVLWADDAACWRPRPTRYSQVRAGVIGRR